MFLLKDKGLSMCIIVLTRLLNKLDVELLQEEHYQFNLLLDVACHNIKVQPVNSCLTCMFVYVACK